ncbi:group 1 glycosyl transferase [Methylobacterium currus]|uniref:Group 1 glycosyl transferase n=1 Tax=Methylobacterium currus TaxID=2051553 RepID=A0A2R4WNW5_9HYPH|nr:glycosyltransferase [Methylobacterium currus]AWB23213.1 group 1 glycosyl transferase [Methylobacterium currus]UHC17257.1 glycosyltransferase [Methylobacterium currus]
MGTALPHCAPLSVLLLDTEPRTSNAYIALAVADALRRHPAVGRVVRATHADAVALAQGELARGGRFDLVLALGGASRHHALLRRLCALAGTSALWTTEDPYLSAANARLSGCFDLVFTNDRGSLPRYGAGARHLPLAATTLFQDLSLRPDDAAYRYDLLFVGTAWPNRVATLNRILSAFPRGLKVKIALPANAYLPQAVLVRDDLVVDWRCGNEDFARLANASRVVLTLPRIFTAGADETPSGTTPPPRLFEVALAGGAQLVVGAHPETFDYYEAGREIRACAEDDAVPTIAALLADPAGRIAMAERARARTRGEHLYDHRVDVIVRAVRERGTVPRLPAVESSGSIAEDAPPVAAKPRLLFVAHNRAGRRPGGGVEFYQEQLAGAIDGFETLFLYPSFEEDAWVMRLDEGEASEALPIPPAERLLASSEIEALVERILVERRIDLVHVHHLLGLPLSLPAIARAHGVPVVAQLHDFFLICHRYTLMNQHGVFCDVVNRGEGQCDGCLATAEGLPAGAKARRDGFVARMLGSIDALVTSTPATADYVRAFYPEVTARVAVIEMVDAEPARLPSPPGPVAPATSAPGPRVPMRVAVLGNVVDHKGARTLLELVRITQGEGYVFEVLGYVASYLVAAFEAQAGERLTLRGGYTREEVPALLAGCDVSLHLSLWPETYMISLTEAWRAGLIPIVTDLGAPGERVTDGVDGLKVPPGESGAVRQALRRLRHDPALVAALRAAIARKTLPGMVGHATSMAALYRELIAARPAPHAAPDEAPAPFTLSALDLGFRLNHPDWTDPAIVWDGAEETSAVTDALPLAVAGLPERVLAPSDPGLSWEIADLVVDGQRLPGRIGACAACDSLSLRGWIWRPEAGRPTQTWLRLRSGVATRYVTALPERRPELAGRFGTGRAEQAGFAVQIRIADLPAGLHTVDLLQVFPDHVAVAHEVARFTAPDVSAPGPVTPWRTGLTVPERALRRSAEPARLASHGLPIIEGVPVARQGGRTRLAVQVPEGARRGPSFLVLTGDEGTAWARAQWRDEDGTAWIGIEAQVRDIPPGPYRVSALIGDESGADLYETGTTLFVAPTARACLVTAEPPPALRLAWIPPVRSRLNLDAVTVGEASTLLGTPVTVAGWCFAPGRGRPLAWIARWGARGRRRFMIAESVTRQDVAVHLRDSDALNAGFEIQLPLDALRDGSLRVFQVYERGAVALSGFPRHVLGMIPAEALAG